MTTQTSDLEPLSTAKLKELSADEYKSVLTLQMPTHQNGRETQQNPIRYKNLVSEAEQRIGDDSSLTSLVDQLRERIDDHHFWQHQGDGLLVHGTPGNLRYFRLRRDVPERVQVGSMPFLRDVMPPLHAIDDAFVLTLTWEQAGLQTFAAGQLSDEHAGEFPVHFDDLVLPRDPEESLQFSSQSARGPSGGGQAAMYHGHGEGEDRIEADRENYLTRVGRLVSSQTYNDPRPLVAVGTQELLGHFGAASGLDADVSIAASPAELSGDELSERVRQMLAEGESQAHENFEKAYSAAMSGERVATKPVEVATAAMRGQVQQLVIGNDVQAEGTLDVDSAEAKTAGDGTKVCLVNAAAIHTLRYGGTVHRCDADQLPDSAAQLIAILRL